MPYIDRHGRQPAWRKLVEGSYNLTELSDALANLDSLRTFGVHTPPYSAFEEEDTDGDTARVLYVGHIEGASFEDMSLDNEIVKDYRVLGAQLLKYLRQCENESKPYLTDITKIDQYLYGIVPSTGKCAPILVDLELHNSDSSCADQLLTFYEDFIVPLRTKR